jgi:general secretion pathway protein D
MVASCAGQQGIKQGDLGIQQKAPAPEKSTYIDKKGDPSSLVKPSEEPKKPARSEQIRVEEDAKDKNIVLNFVNADIESVISAVAGILDINYILSPGIKGNVTIQSSKKFPLRDMHQIFQNILEVNGLTAVKDGSIYKIVPIETAKQQPNEVQSGKKVITYLDAGFITQVVPLEYVKASDVMNITRSLMPRGAEVIVYEPSNLLIVTAPPSGLLKFMKILEAIDIPSTERESVRTYVYYVENGEAKKLAELLRNIYGEKGSSAKNQSRVITPSPVSGQTSYTNQSASSIASTILEGDISVTPYEDINALIIKASARNYLAISETLKRLDIPTKQVLIEVLIAEVTLTDSSQFGIEWMLKGPISIEGKRVTSLSGFTTGTQAGTIEPVIDATTGQVGNIITTPASGTVFASIINPGRYGAILNAFASVGKLNVLANPNILAMDNKEAKIEIGDEIPIATGFQQQPATSLAGTNSFVAAGQIQYRTTGIILTVTPHITEKNMVKLKIAQEISSRGADVTLAGVTSPSFSKRKAETIGAVQQGHTLIIGGLISEHKNNAREGIPLLSSIPIIGPLFGVNTEEIRKTELVIMVTPHVINSVEEADMITKEFQNKVKTIKKRLDEERK